MLVNVSDNVFETLYSKSGYVLAHKGFKRLLHVLDMMLKTKASINFKRQHSVHTITLILRARAPCVFYPLLKQYEARNTLIPTVCFGEL